MAWGATYYMRADGLASSASQATSCSSRATAMGIATHNSQAFLPGDHIVLCDEGGVFRDELRIYRSGTAASLITYDGRGTAVIAASDLVADWVPAGGNVYAASLPIQPQQLFINGRYGDRKSGTGGLVDEDDWYWSSNTLYLWAPGDPDVRYSSPGVEAGARTRCVNVTGNHVTVEGLTVKHSNQHNILAYNGTGVTFADLTSEWAWELGIVISGNTLQSNNTIRDCVARFNGTGGISSAYSGAGRMAYHSYLRNTCFENGRHQHADPLWSPNHTFTFGIKLWGNHLSSNGVVIAENKCFENGPFGTVINSSQKGNGIWIDEIDGSPGDPIVIRHNLSYNNWGSGVFLENSSYNDIYSNVLYRNSLGSEAVTPYSAGGVKLLARVNYHTSHNNVLSNTIVGGWIGLQVTSYDQQAGLEVSNNTFRNNIVVETTGRVLRATGGGDNATWGSGNVYDNNCFGAATNSFIRWGSVDFSAYATWESAYGQSTNSIEEDPQLASASPDTCYLTAASPCRDGGANLGPQHDDALLESSAWADSVVVVDQDEHGSAWEVGAYVYSGGSASLVFVDGFESGNTSGWSLTTG
jgi:parallel beta-helix repeat protein